MKDSQNELLAFFQYISQEVSESASQRDNGGFLEDAFTQLAADLLSNSGESGIGRVCRASHSNKAGSRIMQMNGYAIWDTFETLDIFITAYRNDDQLYTLDKNRMTTNLNLVRRYLEFAELGDHSGLEESAAEQEFLENFRQFRENLSRVRLILLTNGLVQASPPEVKSNGSGLTIINEIWDLQRLYQLWSSGKQRAPIIADLPAEYGQKIRFLTIDVDKDGYMACLTIIPGKLLADLYDKYGTRLFEQNVRVYLQNKGKVNKEIRRTILDSPDMFMAYNNGISATATGITFARDPVTNRQIIQTITGLQIVNGGQTTSSIYYAWKKDRKPIDKVWLQMKITLIKDETKTDVMVSRISRYANSQNKVTETDLTSNQRFHVVLEELSRTTWTPSVPGKVTLTRWYYERSKGQYREDLNREFSPSRKKNFKEKNPSEQVIRKEELAKFRNAWNKLPFWVVKGSQKNYLQFIEKEKNIEPTREYFKETVAMGIIFKTAEMLYGKKPHAMGDLRYLVVPYSIAWLSHHTEERLDLSCIWKQQHLPQPLEDILETILLRINSFFQNDKPNEYALVGEWAKKDECWEDISKISAKSMGVDLRQIKKLLVDPDDGEINSMQDAVQIRSVSLEQWEIIENFGQHGGRLSPLQKGAIHNIISRIKRQQPLTEQLIVHGAAALHTYAHHRRKKQ